MPYHVKGMRQILPMLEVKGSEVEDRFYAAPAGPEPSLLFSNYLFGLGFKPLDNDFQHNFARMTDETDSSVVLALL